MKNSWFHKKIKVAFGVSLHLSFGVSQICHFEPQGEILKELKLMVMEKISPA
jgi:hypothetical protein